MEAHFNDTEVDTMPHRWPANTDYIVWELDVLDRDCTSCGCMMHICDLGNNDLTDISALANCGRLTAERGAVP